MTASMEAQEGLVEAESSSTVTAQGEKIGREVRRGGDGSRTTTEWTHYEDGSHRETTVTEAGGGTTTTTSVTTPTDDGSRSHTETTTVGSDGTTTRTVSDSRSTTDGVTRIRSQRATARS